MPSSCVLQGWSTQFSEDVEKWKDKPVYLSHFFTDFLFVILGKLFKTGNLFLAAYESTELN